MVYANIPQLANMKRVRSIFALICLEANKKSCEYGAPLSTVFNDYSSSHMKEKLIMCREEEKSSTYHRVIICIEETQRPPTWAFVSCLLLKPTTGKIPCYMLCCPMWWELEIFSMRQNQCCGSGSMSNGSVIKWPAKSVSKSKNS